MTTSPSASESPPPAHERHFNTNHLVGDLKQRSVRGGAVTMVAQFLKFALNVASTMVLARLLTQADFGLVAMVTAVTNFVLLFRDAGLSMATVQRAEINHAQISTLFWLNLVLSLLLTGIVMAAAPAIAAFYGRPELVPITLVFAVSILFGGFTIQHQALLRRQMRFKSLGIIEITSMLASATTGIGLGLYWQNYWALVAMPVAGTLAYAILVWVFCDWRPGWPRRNTGVRPMVRFGANLTGSSFVNYFARNTDNVLIGWWWGAAALGLYSRAYALLLQPVRQINMPISTVFLPALSRVQNDAPRHRSISLRLLRAMAVFACPIVVLLAVFADEIVRIIFGPGWEGVIPIFRWLSIACITQVASSQVSSILMSLGRADLLLRTGIINGLIAVAAITGGLPWGPAGVAAAYATSGVVLRLPILLGALTRTGRFTRAAVYHAMAPAIATGLTAIGGAFALRGPLVAAVGPLPAVALMLAAVTVWYAIAYSVLPACRQGVREARELFLSLRRREPIA